MIFNVQSQSYLLIRIQRTFVDLLDYILDHQTSLNISLWCT